MSKKGEKMKKILTTGLLSIAAVAVVSTSASADPKTVWGGGAQGESTYTDKYVPQVISGLDSVRMSGYKWSGKSEGTMMNLEKVTENPTHLAVVQKDLAEANKDNNALDYKILHDNIGPECLYKITKSPNYTNFGHVLGNSWDLTLVTGG